MSEIFYALEKEYLPEEIVEMLRTITEDDVVKYALDNDVCPKCYFKLINNTWKEESEHFGFPAMETMGNMKCSGCGEVYE